jgi:hypothetical protein
MSLHRISLLAAAAVAALSLPLPVTALGEGNQGPVCVDGITQVVQCAGLSTTVTVDASNSFDPDGDDISFLWQACPGAFVVDPTAATTQVIIDTSITCNYICGIRVRVTDEFGLNNACRTYVQVVGGGQGCTPGYWKNHHDAWASTGYAPTDDFDTVFGVNAFTPDRDLITALRAGGGGANKLGRMAVACLLNASHGGLNQPHSANYYILAVRAAFLAGVYEPLASELDADANLGCPLN